MPRKGEHVNVIKNAAAGLVLAVAFPILVGVAADPLGDETPLETWRRGAAILGAVVAIKWAIWQLGGSGEQAD